ncbi:histidine phosphatase family protein [Propionivibrio dicarboxylicus]|uniref:Probable phosphoglycerate mutase n=1 Tax=Propionivibrio dicarboxylicus TaxID=83767 RepID=A0A1G7Z1C8_9RHOO|nr:histidine phosphatase family protein [Propionivibrio dicarboxylicus]SDH02434.1 probable phosphoglycerate mutase [Propionivibrio dicarboxylicus]
MQTNSTQIIFIRHGETEWNLLGKYQGQSDVHLNARGLSQSRLLATKFDNCLSISKVYSSDLTRAVQTATPLSEVLCLPIFQMETLRERNFGRCEGLTIEEIARKYPEDAQALVNGITDYVIPGGESLKGFSKRVITYITSLVSDHPNETLVVVTHGGVLDMLLCRITGADIRSPMNTTVNNSGMCSVFFTCHEWAVEYWNSTPHLCVGN